MPARALAVLLVVAAGVVGAAAGSDRSAAATGRSAARGAARVRRVPHGRAHRTRREDRRRALPELRRPGAHDPPGSGAPPRSSTRPPEAVPAILDARAPRQGYGPRLRGPSGQRVHALRLARLRRGGRGVGVPALPAQRLPGVHARHGRGRARPPARRRAPRAYCAAGSPRCGGGAGPTLYMQHALLPHEPWIYLPSGRQNRPSGKDPVGAVNRPIGFHDPDLTDHNHLRHLLQVGSVDREIGLLIRRLRSEGLFDRALIAVVADHGYSFEVGAERSPAGQRHQHRADRPGSLLRQGSRPAEGPRGRPARAHRGRPPHDRRPARTCGSRGLTRAGRRSRHPRRRRQVVRIPRRDFSRVVSIDRAELERRAPGPPAVAGAEVRERRREPALPWRPVGVRVPDRAASRADRPTPWSASAWQARARCARRWPTRGCSGASGPTAACIPRA